MSWCPWGVAQLSKLHDKHGYEAQKGTQDGHQLRMPLQQVVQAKARQHVRGSDHGGDNSSGTSLRCDGTKNGVEMQDHWKAEQQQHALRARTFHGLKPSAGHADDEAQRPTEDPHGEQVGGTQKRRIDVPDLPAVRKAPMTKVTGSRASVPSTTVPSEATMESALRKAAMEAK